MPRISKGEEQAITSKSRIEGGSNSGAQAIAAATDAVGKQIEQINRGYFEAAQASIENSIYNNAISKATTEFNERYLERINQKFDDNGNPTYGTLQQDITRIADEVEQKYAPFLINPNTNQRFKASYMDLKQSKMLQANVEMRNQQLNIAQAQTSETIFNFLQQMEKDPTNKATYSNQINEVLQAAVLDGTMTPLAAESFRQKVIHESERIDNKLKQDQEKAVAEAQAAQANDLQQKLIKGDLVLAKSIVEGSAEQFGVSEKQYTQLLRGAQSAVATAESKARSEFIDAIKDKAEANPEFRQEIQGLTREEFNNKYGTELDRRDFEQAQAIAGAVEKDELDKANSDVKKYNSNVSALQSQNTEILKYKIRNGEITSEAELLKELETTLDIEETSKGIDLNNVPAESRNQTKITLKQFNQLADKLKAQKKSNSKRDDILEAMNNTIKQGGSLAEYTQDNIKALYDDTKKKVMEQFTKDGVEFNVNGEIAILKQINTPINKVKDRYVDLLFNGSPEKAAEALQVFKAAEDIGLRTFDNMSKEDRALVGLATHLSSLEGQSEGNIITRIKELKAMSDKEKDLVSDRFNQEKDVKDFNKNKGDLMAEILNVDFWTRDGNITTNLEAQVLSSLQEIYKYNGGNFEAAKSVVSQMYKEITGESSLAKDNAVTFYPPEKVYGSVATPTELNQDLQESFKEDVPEGSTVYIGSDTAIMAGRGPNGNIIPSYPAYYINEQGVRISLGRWTPVFADIKARQGQTVQGLQDKALEGQRKSQEAKGLYGQDLIK